MMRPKVSDLGLVLDLGCTFAAPLAWTHGVHAVWPLEAGTVARTGAEKHNLTHNHKVMEVWSMDDGTNSRTELQYDL